MIRWPFQAFELDTQRMIDELSKLSEEERIKLSLFEKGKALTSSLNSIPGCRVLVDLEMCCGLPTSLLVTGDLDKIKGSFYEIVEKLGIAWYKSGKVYYFTLS